MLRRPPLSDRSVVSIAAVALAVLSCTTLTRAFQPDAAPDLGPDIGTTTPDTTVNMLAIVFATTTPGAAATEIPEGQAAGAGSPGNPPPVPDFSQITLPSQ